MTRGLGGPHPVSSLGLASSGHTTFSRCHVLIGSDSPLALSFAAASYSEPAPQGIDQAEHAMFLLRETLASVRFFYLVVVSSMQSRLALGI